jgi:hypothetical protein
MPNPMTPLSRPALPVVSFRDVVSKPKIIETMAPYLGGAGMRTLYQMVGASNQHRVMEAARQRGWYGPGADAMQGITRPDSGAGTSSAHAAASRATAPAQTPELAALARAFNDPKSAQRKIDEAEENLTVYQDALEACSDPAQQASIVQAMMDIHNEANNNRALLDQELVNIDPMATKQKNEAGIEKAILRSVRSHGVDGVKRIIASGNLALMRDYQEKYHYIHAEFVAQSRAAPPNMPKAWVDLQRENSDAVFDGLQQLNRAIGKIEQGMSLAQVRQQLRQRIKGSQAYIEAIEHGFNAPALGDAVGMGIHEQTQRQMVHYLDLRVAQWRKKIGPDHQVGRELHQELAQTWQRLHDVSEEVLKAFLDAPAGGQDEQRLGKTYHYLQKRKSVINKQLDIRKINPEDADLSTLERLTGESPEAAKATYAKLWRRTNMFHNYALGAPWRYSEDNIDPYKLKAKAYYKSENEKAVAVVGAPPEAPDRNKIPPSQIIQEENIRIF